MSHSGDFWTQMARPPSRSVVVGGVELRRGSRVRLAPRARADVLDLALAGRGAVVESIEQNAEGEVHLAVTLDDDPGRDLGEARFIGHRFFFGLDEVEPVEPPEAAGDGEEAPRVLVAGIGNVFLGDDGFGVAVAWRLAERPLPAGVRVVDFGIRGLDLAYALQDGWAAVVLVDATPRGGEPGTLYVIEPDAGGDSPAALDAHGMDPVRVLRLARSMGGVPARTLVVGCEPLTREPGDDEGPELGVELSAPVRGAVDEAVRLVESLVAELRQGGSDAGPTAER